MRRRIVITGLGAVTPFGVGVSVLWEGLVAGRSALAPITRFDASGFTSKLAGEVKDFSARDHVPKHYRKAVKVMARDIELAVGAARFAVEDAGLVTRGTLGDAQGSPTYPEGRMGCQIGAGLIATETEELTSALITAAAGEDRQFTLKAWGETGIANLQPLWMLKYLPNMPACHVTIIHGAEGPSNTITCGEASGLLSIGESSRVIERGAADLCFSGGAESRVNLMGLLRMQMAGRLGDTGSETDGSRLVRPYDPTSMGVTGEGGGILILEELDLARRRGAKVYAEIAGFGAGQSSWPPYLPYGERDDVSPDCNDGLRLAIERSLRDAGVTPSDVDVIVPLAAGSPLEDEGELRALRAVFGDRLGEIPLVTLTPAIGNCVAGAGGIAAAVASKAIAEQRLPARLHAGSPPKGVCAGASESAGTRIRTAVVCSSSVGGQNASIVMREGD